MYRLFVFAVVVCSVVLADYAPIPILKDDRTQNAYGESSFNFETGNGIVRSESGAQNDGQNTNGQWSYTSPEGQKIDLQFVADQGGYQPQGAHLPVPPQDLYERTYPQH